MAERHQFSNSDALNQLRNNMRYNPTAKIPQQQQAARPTSTAASGNNHASTNARHTPMTSPEPKRRQASGGESRQHQSSAATPPSVYQPAAVEQQTRDTNNNATRPVTTYVGFANVPNQVFRRVVSRGFDFTLMVVGETGLGKSTFINSLFMTDKLSAPTTHGKGSTTKISEHTVAVKENNVTLNLTLVDTPGYGDQVDNSECWKPIMTYIDRQCLAYLNEESKVVRANRIVDRRVHCVLYFIAPTGHGLKALDIACLQQLHTRVNVIPVLAKADTYTAAECAAMKRHVMADLRAHNIKIYEFPSTVGQPVTGGVQLSADLLDLQARVPFAVIGSDATVERSDGRIVRARQYPWGVVELESLTHNDYIALRDVVLRTHLIDLIDVTSVVHYENYRAQQLSKRGDGGGKDSAMTFTALQQESVALERQMADDGAKKEHVLQEKIDGIKTRNNGKRAKNDMECDAVLAAIANAERQLETQKTRYDRLCVDEPVLAARLKLEHSRRTSSTTLSDKSPSSSTLRRMPFLNFNR